MSRWPPSRPIPGGRSTSPAPLARSAPLSSTSALTSSLTARPQSRTASRIAPRPQGTYAISKLLGEWFAAELPRAYVLRVESLFGGANAKSSVDFLLRAIRAGKEARAFSDRVVSPSYVDDVVEATSALIERDGPPGLYHCVNTGLTTWFELARELARLAGRPDAVITAIQMKQAGLKTPRPRFAALSNAKLASVGIAMPTWQDALRRYVNGQ